MIAGYALGYTPAGRRMLAIVTRPVFAHADVPFCAAATVATAVVLSRRSGPERVRPAAPTTAAAKRGSACCSAGAGGLWFCPLYDI